MVETIPTKTFVGFGATNTCSLLFEVLLSSLLAFSPFAFLFTFVGPFLLKPLALLACAFSMFSFGSKTLSILQTCCRCLCLDLGSSGSVVRICWFVAPFGHVLSTRETAKNVQKDFGAHIAWPLIAVSRDFLWCLNTCLNTWFLTVSMALTWPHPCFTAKSIQHVQLLGPFHQNLVFCRIPAKLIDNLRAQFTCCWPFHRSLKRDATTGMLVSSSSFLGRSWIHSVVCLRSADF